jgi:hypothetical protein
MHRATIPVVSILALVLGLGVASPIAAQGMQVAGNGLVQIRIVDYVTGNAASAPTFDALATDYKVQLHPYVLNLESNLEYTFDATGCAGDCGSAATSVGDGIGAWSDSGLTVTQNNATTANNPCTGNPNSVSWSSLGTNVVGETIPCHDPDTGQIYGFDMIFNSDLTWSDCTSVATCTSATSGEFSIAATAAHEGGHVYGLGHVHAAKDLRLTMYFGIGPNDYGRATLGCGDLYGVNALYGTGLDCLSVPTD